jgi:hypothetical protein
LTLTQDSSWQTKSKNLRLTFTHTVLIQDKEHDLLILRCLTLPQADSGSAARAGEFCQKWRNN